MDINIKPIDPDPRVPDEPIDIYGMHPWHHPGRAPVWSPCGIGGGNPRGCFVPGTSTPQKCPEGASQNGPDARYFPFPDVKTTVCEYSNGCSGYLSTRSLTQPLLQTQGRRAALPRPRGMSWPTTAEVTPTVSALSRRPSSPPDTRSTRRASRPTPWTLLATSSGSSSAASECSNGRLGP